MVQYTFKLKTLLYNTIPKDSLIQLTFPSDYSGILPSSPICQTTGTPVRNMSCTLSGTTVTITNYFNTDIYDSIFTVVITNIKNPSHTGAMGYFSALINTPTPTNVFAASTASVVITTAAGKENNYFDEVSLLFNNYGNAGPRKFKRCNFWHKHYKRDSDYRRFQYHGSEMGSKPEFDDCQYGLFYLSGRVASKIFDVFLSIRIC